MFSRRYIDDGAGVYESVYPVGVWCAGYCIFVSLCGGRWGCDELCWGGGDVLGVYMMSREFELPQYGLSRNTSSVFEEVPTLQLQRHGNLESIGK